MKRIKNNPAKYVQRSVIAGVASVALKDQPARTAAQPYVSFNFMDAAVDDRFYFDFTPHPSPPPIKKK